MTDTAAARILADLRDRYGKAPYDPAQDVTVRDAMTFMNCSPDVARCYLDAEVAAGRLTKRKVNVNGANTSVYRHK